MATTSPTRPSQGRRTDAAPRAARVAHLVRHEALRTGLAGAANVTAWLLASDALNRTPLSTPALLGWWIAASFGFGAIPRWGHVLVFLVFLVLAWVAIGAGLARAARVAAARPAVVAFAVVVTILVQLLAVGITEILSQAGMGAMAWRDVLVGELVGCSTVAILLLRRHPELPAAFRAGSHQ